MLRQLLTSKLHDFVHAPTPSSILPQFGRYLSCLPVITVHPLLVLHFIGEGVAALGQPMNRRGPSGVEVWKQARSSGCQPVLHFVVVFNNAPKVVDAIERLRWFLAPAFDKNPFQPQELEKGRHRRFRRAKQRLVAYLNYFRLKGPREAQGLLQEVLLPIEGVSQREREVCRIDGNSLWKTAAAVLPSPLARGGAAPGFHRFSSELCDSLFDFIRTNVNDQVRARHQAGELLQV